VAGLGDLILAFRAVTGSPAAIPCLSDTNDDGQIGAAEMVWLLGHISE